MLNETLEFRDTIKEGTQIYIGSLKKQIDGTNRFQSTTWTMVEEISFSIAYLTCANSDNPIFSGVYQDCIDFAEKHSETDFNLIEL
jgi:hypothetical protein